MTKSTIFDRLLELSVLLSRDMGNAFEEIGLTTARTHLLWVVHSLGPSTQTALASALEVSPRNISGLVDALEQSGHVIRTTHPMDRRATVVSLTELGTETMRSMAEDHTRISELMESRLSDPVRFEQELTLIIETLRALVDDPDMDSEGRRQP